MCGEIPPGHFKVDVVLHFAANSTQAQIAMNRQLEYVVSVRLHEYQVVTPSGTLWRLDLGDQLRFQDGANLPGDGHPLAMFDPALTHQAFDSPREFLCASATKVNMISGKLRQVTATTDVSPTHGGATFWLSVICRDPQYQPDRRQHAINNAPETGEGRNGGRAPWVWQTK